MRPNSEINEVHVSMLGADYGRVVAYFRDRDPQRRRSYWGYLDGNAETAVYALNDSAQSVTFQSECLLPADDRGRPRVMLLFSNAHPESIKNGMFHTAEGRVAALWRDLCEIELFSADERILRDANSLRAHCLNLEYNGPFAFGFACYWIFPTFHPGHLLELFEPRMEPPGFEDTEGRLGTLLASWKPRAIISFNGQVLEAMTKAPSAGYLESLRDRLIQRTYQEPEGRYPVFQTYPTGWRFGRGATDLRRASLERIRDAILRNE